MAGPEFFQTHMGHRFYERDVPKIADALERIAKALEKQSEPMVAVAPEGTSVAGDRAALDALTLMLRDRAISLHDIIELVKSTGRSVL